MHYVYAGNVPMHPGENTACHSCQTEVIRRVGYRIAANNLKDGRCPKCGTRIPGVWSQQEALAGPRGPASSPERAASRPS